MYAILAKENELDHSKHPVADLGGLFADHPQDHQFPQKHGDISEQHPCETTVLHLPSFRTG